MTANDSTFEWVDEPPVDEAGFLSGLSASRRRFMRNAAVVGGVSLLLGGAGTGIAAADHQPPIYGLTLVPGDDEGGSYGGKNEKKDDENGDDGDTGENALALLARNDGTDNALVPVDLDSGEILTSDAVSIDGVSGDTLLVGLDYRPSDEMLYALGEDGTLYTVGMPDDDYGDSVDAETVGSAEYPNTDLIDGIGFDFNPVADAIRIVTTDGDSFVTSADDGSIVRQDPDTFYADDDENAGTTPQLSAAGYTNSVPDPDSTELYDIDSNLDVLVEQTANPDVDNTSELETVGDLGVDTGGVNGFDISGSDGTAYALLPVDGQSQLYTIDLDTGMASPVDGEDDMMADEVDDLAILNFALTLEHLEAAYYNDFLDEYSESEVERSEAARVFADPGSRFSVYQKIQTVRDHEEAHVEALTQTIQDLGGEPVEPAEYEFPYETIEEFVSLSAAIEAVGVSAYAGAAPLIESDAVLEAAASILSVEARHTAYFNVLNTTSPFPDAFDEPRTMEEVLEIASQYIVSE